MFMIGAALFVLILILFLVWQIIRWWNLPKVTEERAKKVKARQDARTERLRIRRQRRTRTDADGKPIVNQRRNRWFRRKQKEQGVQNGN
jgi:cell division protein FtsI/penicillin-binding protein 2